MNSLTYICTFFGTAACTFVGASQNTPRTWEGWLFLIVGSLGSGAIALKALLTDKP
jgi:hypothetical protein